MSHHFFHGLVAPGMIPVLVSAQKDGDFNPTGLRSSHHLRLDATVWRRITCWQHGQERFNTQLSYNKQLHVRAYVAGEIQHYK